MREAVDAFGDRMKRYEAVSDAELPRRLPVVLRLDGNSFSRFTQAAKFEKPFDEHMLALMIGAATAVLEYCSGAVFGYTQSDEISVLLRNDQTTETDPFLGNRVQKLTSLCASVCTGAFIRGLDRLGVSVPGTTPAFDCRAFVVPTAEVANYLLWRQRDAFKNCVGSLCRWTLGAKVGGGTAMRQVHGMATEERIRVLQRDAGVDLAALPPMWHRGVAIVREVFKAKVRDLMPKEKLDALVAAGKANPDEEVVRHRWKPDYATPEFGVDRRYVERWLDPTPEAVHQGA